MTEETLGAFGVWFRALIFFLQCVTFIYAWRTKQWTKTAAVCEFLAVTVILLGFILDGIESHASDVKLDYIYENTARIAQNTDDQFLQTVHDRDDVIAKEDIFLVDVYVRKYGESGKASWTKTIDANIEDEIEFRVDYRNKRNETPKQVDNVMARIILPTNMQYVENSTLLYNASYQEGTRILENTVCSSGINIGNYAPYGNAQVRFRTVVMDKTLAEGVNQLVTWATITVNEEALYDGVDVYVEK